MSKYQAVADSFRTLVGTGADDIQNAYGMQGDWCAMTVFIGFRNAGALDNLADGMKTAWVPSLWDWYNNRGMTGDNPQAGALTFFDFNANGTPDHIEYCDSVESNSVFTDIAGNTGDCAAVQYKSRINDSNVLGFAYPDYSEGTDVIAATAPQEEEEEEMVFIYQPNDGGTLYLYDGMLNHPLANNDEVVAIQKAYKASTDKDIPMFPFGSKDAPWATRFWQATERLTPNMKSVIKGIVEEAIKEEKSAQ